VFSLNPVPGALDLLVSSELLETARQIHHATSDRTQVISSLARTLTTAEKMVPGDGRQGSDALADTVRAMSAEAQLLDMNRLAREAGTVMSAVMFGAIAGSGVLPFERAAYRATIEAGGKGVAPSLRGFDAGCDAVRELRAERAAVQAAIASVQAPATPAPPASYADFPPATHDILALGHARMLDYQDAAYADLYAQRLMRVLAAERAGDPAGKNGFAATRETARWLALWMAFDDIVRVADLKSRASRFDRVTREVGAEPGDVLRIFDHFKPGVPEFAGLLPQRLAEALTRWDRRRVLRGRAPFAIPLKLRSDSVFGLLTLRALAACKRLRRHGSRHAIEQAMIERWLAAIERGARTHAALGREIAACGRLIKGYGTTNERGKASLLHVIDHLAETSAFATVEARCAAIAAARDAALADDAGKALDRVLQEHGAPPRPIREQPVTWVTRRPGGSAERPRKTA
jgi:indolepyruvate ferredoxin oxidoreductase beta subunit